MKKIYIAPDTEIVNVKLISSVMDPGNLPIGHSPYAEDPLAKENNLLFDDDAWDNDLWDDSDNTTDSYDIWKE